MARFNTSGHKARPAVAFATSPITTISDQPDTRTFEGAPGWTRTAESEIFLLATSSFLGGENSFYESGSGKDARARELTRKIAVNNPQWGLDFATWLRGPGNIRTGALMFAAEYVKARLDAEKQGSLRNPEAVNDHAYRVLHYNRRIINAVCQRPDEPGELLAYWTSQYGRKIPKPVKRGLADAVRRLYTQKNLLKYDTASKGYRFGDILNLVHAAPDPDKPWQGDLFQYALDRRHNPDTAVVPDSLPVIQANRTLMALPVEDRRKYVLDQSLITTPGGLGGAGITWEALAGWLQGPMDKAAWEAVIPSMGIMALIRNLRNFDQAEVSDAVAAQIIAKLTDPQEIARSKQFPFRFLSAYQATKDSLRWAYPLEQALGYSLANVPALPGRTLVLVDRSGSMFGPRMSEKSDLSRADGAAIFGTAVALRAHSADLIQFGSTSQQITFKKGDSVLPLLKRFTDLGGTYTATATKKYYAKHDRVIIITDGQSHDGDPGSQVPADVPVYTWNLAGYRPTHGRIGSNARFELGGLTDKAFALIPLLEAGAQGAWPWQLDATE